MSDWPVHPAAELFQMVSGPDLDELAVDISEHGLYEPVWLWRDDDGTDYLLDGRNRLAACERAGVEVRTQRYEGDEPTSFAVSLNVQRRHLTPGQKGAVAFEMLPLLEEEGRKRKAAAAAAARRREAAERAAEADRNAPPLVDFGDEDEFQEWADLPTLDADPKPPKPEPVKPQPNRARDVAAKTTGTSGRVVAQYKRIAEQAPDLAEKVKSGEMPIDRADRVIRDRDAEQKRVDQAKAEAAKMGDVATVDIRHGDFREILADLAGVDAIITDPPYPHEFIPLLGDLALWADKVLGPDGILAVLIGQTYLPEVYRLLDAGRPYRWTGCYLTAGAGYVSHPRKVQSNWKPLIVYGGGPRFADVVTSTGNDADAKNNHKWGQDYNAFHTIVERLTIRGQTIVDPFMGSGTTLLAAHVLGRNTIGCDIDEQHVTKARERLS